MQKKRLHLSHDEWEKLQGFNAKLTRTLVSALPSDFSISPEDVSGAVYDTIIHLLSTYRPGTLSPTSYVYQYAEQYTRRDLLREYFRAKTYLRLDDRGEHDRFDSREYGEGDVPELTVDEREQQEIRDQVQGIMERATPEDRRIMEDILSGMTYDDIAAKHGITKMAVTRRMRKYANLKD